MKKRKLSEMHRGWLIGDFEPSILKTKSFEIGIITHKKGEDWKPHYHKESTEYNVLIKGSMTMHGEKIKEGDIFILEKYEIGNPIFLENCTVLVIKIPSVPGDKYEVLR